MLKLEGISIITIKLMGLALIFFALSGLRDASSSEHPVLTMATTTSTDNTGLLDYLAPIFRADTGVELRWVSVGTGKALTLGRNCDVDVLMVHDPEAEEEFMKGGFGLERRPFMYNDFILIGPQDDPAGIRGMLVDQVMKNIAKKGAVFVSRGDGSGTHKREMSLWRVAGLSIPGREPWYIETGQGMRNTIQIAEELGAYTLTDRGTYIQYEADNNSNPALVMLVEGESSFINQYSVIIVNPQRCRDVKIDLAKRFVKWLVSSDTQRLIAEYKILGKQLFIPNASAED